MWRWLYRRKCWACRARTLKKNPLKNLGAMLKLNPYAKSARRAELLAQVGPRGLMSWHATFDRVLSSLLCLLCTLLPVPKRVFLRVAAVRAWCSPCMQGWRACSDYINPGLSGHMWECLTPPPHVHTPVQERRAKEKGLEKARRERSEEAKATGKKFYAGLMQDSDYQGEDYEVFSAWLGQTQTA